MVSIKELSDENSEIKVTKDPIESTEAMDQKELENAPIPPDQVIEIEEPQIVASDTNDEESQSQTAESNDQNDAQRKKIFVGGLPHGLSEQELRGFFVEFGHMTDIVIIHNKETGRARGFGFVVFDSYEAANNVLKQRFYNIKNKQVEVKKAIPRQQQISRSKAVTMPSAATTFVSGQPQINHYLDSSTYGYDHYHYYRGAYYNTQSYHPYYHNPTFVPNTYYSYGSTYPGFTT